MVTPIKLKVVHLQPHQVRIVVNVFDGDVGGAHRDVESSVGAVDDDAIDVRARHAAAGPILPLAADQKAAGVIGLNDVDVDHDELGHDRLIGAAEVSQELSGRGAVGPEEPGPSLGARQANDKRVVEAFEPVEGGRRGIVLMEGLKDCQSSSITNINN